ncbi:MAG TPA: histidinol dehydrogenase [Thermomicrobiales bacterium]|nr:histidinol dehydrogenase [Thermomicrobiales bacterium]
MSDVIRILTDLSEVRAALTRSRGFEEPELSPQARAGVKRVFGEELTAGQVVDRVLERVRTEGDVGVAALTAAIDGQAPDQVEVPRDEWQSAFDRIDPALQQAMRTAAAQIEAFHRHQVRTSWFETTTEGILGQLVRPIERVGVYAPGGTAVYPSSLLMTAVPARVAGVSEVVVCSPPHNGAVSDLILAAAHVAGVDRVFQIGGAQAIAAMAYGTETVPHVDKIYGPGNIFVVLAKQKLYGVAAIDALPGPTETLLIADDMADPVLAAADLLAQAEHDPMASAILLTDSRTLADRVAVELERQLAELERSAIAAQSLKANGLIGIVPDLVTGVDLANAYAPEHLCLLTHSPWDLVPYVKHAGGLFIGEDSPEALADYTTGPSHVMPTGGSARFFSPVHINDFVKVINVAAANRAALKRLGPATIALARAEGLTAHARAIERRLD